MKPEEVERAITENLRTALIYSYGMSCVDGRYNAVKKHVDRIVRLLKIREEEESYNYDFMGEIDM
jgi:hypothetical protein